MALLDLTLAAFVALAATTVGSLAVMLVKRIGVSAYSVLLSLAAGMMAFSSGEMFLQAFSTSTSVVAVAGLVLGLTALVVADKLLPHLHARVRRKDLSVQKKKALLLTGAIALHNVPEGLAIASAFAASTQLGWLVALTIALQDFPEGLLVSAPLAAYGISNKRSICFGVLSGVVEFFAAIIGYAFLSTFAGFVSLALAFSAGAMLYVVLVELLPDAFSNGRARVAALSFTVGAVLAFAATSFLHF